MTTKIAVFLMADYGHDPTETAIPYKVFDEAGIQISFATEKGSPVACDSKMLTGWTQKMLGADAGAIAAYNEMSQSKEWQSPVSYSDAKFTLLNYDLVFLPGGHEKGVRQLLDSKRAQELVVEYFANLKKPSTKVCAAVCHGVQLLAHSKRADGKSVLHDLSTTALPSVFENTVDYGTRVFLGDYYKTYGAGTKNVEQIVRDALADPARQWKSSGNPGAPFVVEDEKHNYVSGRWPGDAEVLAKRTVELLFKKR
ncbi:hypothetical protein LTR78_007378 [Recurvomyces mirabilis]|uniref:Class I glutamine amidotransferase-like protein n=1 Tax=Recurvomyces mirabilis TaxID=574656 RepID=A0AAE0WJD6_9PEZI|nr:hypothetical protein LTR78_007378 [Recurvomyces mirabilis]